MAEETNMTKTKTNKQMSFMLPIIAKTVTNYSNLQRNIERNVEQKYWKVIKRESDQHLTSPDNVYTSEYPIMQLTWGQGVTNIELYTPE